MAKLERVFLVDWSEGGHNSTHVCAFAEELLALGVSVEVIVGPRVSAELRQNPRLEQALVAGGSLKLHILEWPGFWPVRPRSFQNWLRRKQFARRIRLAIHQGRSSHDFIFFTCLFEQDFDLALGVIGRAKLPWSFLYLHPYLFTDRLSEQYITRVKAAHLLQHPALVGIATMNEHTIPKILSATGKPVVAFPEITDEAVSTDHAIGCRFRDFAAERCMVSCSGYLGSWKGAGFLAQSCLRLDPSKFAFVFAGQMPLETYASADAQAIQECMVCARHALFHLARVPDGPAYNGILKAADVIFCAFKDFHFSSNTLTKAAVVRRLVIVSDGSLAADRVREFGLGLVVPYGDVERLIEVLERLSDSSYRNELVASARWDEYLELHGRHRLGRAFRQLLEPVRNAS